MERGYAGGYFVAADVAQRTILWMRVSEALKHVLYHEVKPKRDAKRWVFHDDKSNQVEPCAAASIGLCFAVNYNNDVTIQTTPATGDSGRLARDVARYLVLYVKKRPQLVHAFYAHERRSTVVLHPPIGKCDWCRWHPKQWSYCDQCGLGACTICISPSSYRPCAHGCCNLCETCHPLVVNETCDLAGCTELGCGKRQPTGCEDKGCWKRLCGTHAKKGGHACEGKRRRVATEAGESE